MGPKVGRRNVPISSQYGYKSVALLFSCQVAESRPNLGGDLPIDFIGCQLLSSRGRAVRCYRDTCTDASHTVRNIDMQRHDGHAELECQQADAGLEGAGAAALTVHGRTAADMFKGSADWDRIAAIKPHLQRIPLIGNGDLDTPQKAVDAFRFKRP